MRSSSAAVGPVGIFALFTAAYFMSYFYRSANAVIAPDLAREMMLDASRLGLMTSLFFAAFAATQLPLGIGLDRWGPRWVTPGLMLIGAAGSLVFAVAPSPGWLMVGRTLLGVGMAGVLMGSLKMFSRWFPAARYATVSGLLVGIGSLGALLAATPMAWFNSQFGWRTIFLAGAAITTVIAGAIMLLTRNAPADQEWHGAEDGLRGLGDVLQRREIWHILPATFFLAGTVLGFQGLWAGPYLYDVYGLTDVQVGNALLWLGAGATLGYTASGWLCDRLGITRTNAVAMAVFVGCLTGLALQPPVGLVHALYFLLGFTGGFNVMLLAMGRKLFPLTMTGKATTTINLFAIGGVFVIQWFMGLVIGQWLPDAGGHYPAAAYRVALGTVAGGAALALLWYLPLARRRLED